MEQDAEVMIKTVEDLLRGKALEEAVDLVSSIHPADQAELFWHLEPELREAFLALLSAEGLAHLLEYLDARRVTTRDGDLRSVRDTP